MTNRPMTKKIIFLISVICVSLAITLSTHQANALRTSRSLPLDERIKVITYHPNDVFKFTGHYEYQSSIVFSKSESISTISMGNSTAWQIVPSGHRMFIKPINNNATTNMTVITNKHIYYFELHAKDVREELGINDEELVFELRFVYPKTISAAVTNYKKSFKPDFSNNSKYNYSYTISGSEYIVPAMIFDDGTFTYMKFPDQNMSIPAIYIVGSDGSESLVNYRADGDYIILEHVTSQLTLRSGVDISCIFNEARPLRKIAKKK